MNPTVRLERLTEKNFADYEKLTSCQKDGGCYCAFWHQKWSSMEEWNNRQKEAPLLNRDTVLDKVRSGFHVGVLAYQNDELLAWVSVGPLTDYYWTWRRLAQVGESGKSTAAITCITIAARFRNRGFQTILLRELKTYGKAQGWTMIEGYPFDESALVKHKENVIWPGLTKGFIEARFERVAPHWLDSPDYRRSIYQMQLLHN